AERLEHGLELALVHLAPEELLDRALRPRRPPAELLRQAAIGRQADDLALDVELRDLLAERRVGTRALAQVRQHLREGGARLELALEGERGALVHEAGD